MALGRYACVSSGPVSGDVRGSACDRPQQIPMSRVGDLSASLDE